MIELLLCFKAQPDCRDLFERSPLEVAQRNMMKQCELLLQRAQEGDYTPRLDYLDKLEKE